MEIKTRLPVSHLQDQIPAPNAVEAFLAKRWEYLCHMRTIYSLKHKVLIDDLENEQKIFAPTIHMHHKKHPPGQENDHVRVQTCFLYTIRVHIWV